MEREPKQDPGERRATSGKQIRLTSLAACAG